MASNSDFVKYVADQCAGAGEISVKKMFGDYGIYCDGKISGLREVELRPPYEGAKNYFLIVDVDDHDYLSMLVRETCKALPEPKKKAAKSKKL